MLQPTAVLSHNGTLFPDLPDDRRLPVENLQRNVGRPIDETRSGRFEAPRKRLLPERFEALSLRKRSLPGGL
jgi:hypothetical protein